MPHQTHTCRCGKTIHWPRNAKIGDRWRCRRCHSVSILAEQGERGRIQASRPSAVGNNPDFLPGSAPRRTSATSGTSPSARSSSARSAEPARSGAGTGTGCMVLLIVIAAAFGAAACGCAALLNP